MADYHVTPYVVSVHPMGDQNGDGRKMGDISLDGISALDAITDTFSVLAKETAPRINPGNDERKLRVKAVRRGRFRVEIDFSLGVNGHISSLQLASVGNAARRYGDTEWFELTATFAASDTARCGILLTSGVGSFTAVTHLRTLIIAALVENVRGVHVKILPIQNAQLWAALFSDMVTKAIEFRSYAEVGDPSEDANGGEERKPLKKVVKISRRGGLGRYSNIVAKSSDEVANEYGVSIPKHGPFDVVATVEPDAPTGRQRRQRKINVSDNRVSSMSIVVERSSATRAPTPTEYLEANKEIISDVREGVRLGNLDLANADVLKNQTEPKKATWSVPDEITPVSDIDQPIPDSQ